MNLRLECGCSPGAPEKNFALFGAPSLGIQLECTTPMHLLKIYFSFHQYYHFIQQPVSHQKSPKVLMMVLVVKDVLIKVLVPEEVLMKVHKEEVLLTMMTRGESQNIDQCDALDFIST